MSDVQRPMILTLLGVLAIITGVFSIIRGGLMIFGGISQLMAGVGGIAEILIGILSLAVGAVALFCGIRVLIDKAGSVGLMQKYAAALIVYNVIWVVFSSVAGGKISWLSVIFEIVISGITLALIKTNEDIKSYQESLQ
jgi:hypothetical protein